MMRRFLTLVGTSVLLFNAHVVAVLEPGPRTVVKLPNGAETWTADEYDLPRGEDAFKSVTYNGLSLLAREA